MTTTGPERGDGREAWRDALAPFAIDGPTDAPARAPDAGPGAPSRPGRATGPTPLALQFELRESIPRTAHRWNGPTSRAVGRTRRSDDPPGTGEYRLGVRPVARTTRGWARGSMTWTNLPHLLHRLDLDPAQHRWFCEFGALHRAVGALALDPDTAWVFLEEFANPVLWSLLDQTGDLGIELVAGTGAATRATASGGSAVTVASRARMGIDVRRGVGGVRLGPRLTIDDTAVDLASARPIGDHGISLVDPSTPRRIVIAPVEGRLSPDQLSVLRGSGPLAHSLEVPDADVDDLLAAYLPGLRERIEVESSDDSVRLPAVAAPTLVLGVRFGPGHETTLAWRWGRGRGSGALLPLASVLPDGLLPQEWTDPSRDTPLDVHLEGAESATFATDVLPRLRTLPGVRVETTGVQPAYRELVGEPELVVSTMPSDTRDWFDLGVTVTVDGTTIPFLPLFTALAKGRKRLLLVDGSHLSLSHPAFSRLAELIAEAKELAEWETTPVISRRHTSLWADFEDLADEALPAVEWRALLAESAGDAPQPTPAPEGLRAELRPYQAEGYSWLAFLWRHRLGGILADDMGLGKTVQCLALVQHIVEEARAVGKDARPVLVVAPTSVVPNWVREAERFTPDLVVRRVSATQAASGVPIAESARGAHIVVTSYGLLRLDAEAYREMGRGAEPDEAASMTVGDGSEGAAGGADGGESGWSALILDEAQFVKNADSLVHRAARDVEAPVVITVTGTPLENSLTELHALLALTAPGLFPSARAFAQQYVRVIEQPAAGITSGRGAGEAPVVSDAHRAEVLARLRRRIRPFLLRRTKEIVAADLPPKTEQTLSIDLAHEHREIYDVYLQRERQKLFGLIEDLDRNRFIVFRSLTLLRLLALDASLVSDEYQGVPSSKLDALVEHLQDVVAEGHRALVFSQFTSYLSIVERRLASEGIETVSLDGSTRDRGGVVDAFRDGDAPVFLISLKAGGFGLNLTEADYVFLLDPWWNPASEAQAVDRAHRIGQDKNVFVYRLIAADTIEEKVLALGDRKARLFDSVMDDGSFASTLVADDIRALLG